jgi:hypothetical protein
MALFTRLYKDAWSIKHKKKTQEDTAAKQNLFDTNNLFNLIANKEVMWSSNRNTEQVLHVLEILHVGRYDAECLTL